MGKSPKLPPFQSSLEKHPEYVRAIGMISIETTSLDIMFGDLLAATLGVPDSIGHAIYLTPRSATARIELFQNVAKYAFPLVPVIDADGNAELRKLHETVNARRSDDRKRVEALLKRAMSVAMKRHKIIHDAWGISVATEEVSARPLPMKPGTTFDAVSLASLNEIIRNLRALIEEVIALAREFSRRRFDAQFSVGLSQPSEGVPGPTSGPSDSRKPSRLRRSPKKRRLPRSSPA